MTVDSDSCNDTDSEESETRPSRDKNSDRAPQRRWLDPDFPEPPMPMASTPIYSDLMLEPGCLGTDPESGAPSLICCQSCSSDLKNDRVPAKAVANHNYLGPVPRELKDLTVVEEAMIALCRAKCWIIQLRDEDPHMPTTQRGVRGHIIVYPQNPSAVATSLPPSIDDVTTPICVVFVGSQPPTAEWLQKKATPLIVRKERVMNALAWLKVHNHLYKDVQINTTVFD
ncbi:hypothetical protein B0H19DRAFT_967449, partial [Mycena capillaripes]